MRLEGLKHVIRTSKEREKPRSQLRLYNNKEIMLYSVFCKHWSSLEDFGGNEMRNFKYNLYKFGTSHGLWSEKAMAPHSSTLAWKIPWIEEPGRLQSMRSLRVRHDWATSLSLFTFMHWRRKWQPTPVFLPGGSQGRGSLVGCRLWGHTEADTTEVT